MRLTEQNVTLAKLKAMMEPGQTEIRVFDDDVPRFGVRYRGGKKRTWFVQYRFGSTQRTLKLGVVDTLSAEKARKAARAALAKAELGHDPSVEKEQAHAAAELTLRAVADQFLDFQTERLKPRSLVEVKRHLTRDWKPLGGLPIKHITRAHVASQIKTIAKESGPFAGNRARASLSTLFTWAMKEGMVDANPVIATNRAVDEEARERVLSDQELVEIWNACRDDAYGRIVRLLILTGQRREEVGGIAEAEINLDARLWSIPKARTKNGLDHDVPLSDPAIEILQAAPRRDDRPFLFGDGAKSFSGWSKAKQALDSRLTAVAPWRLHDIRRTAATRMADLGVLPHVIEAVLNHISGFRGGVAGVYNRATYAAEKRQALDLWGAHVMALIAGQTSSNIVVMRSAS